MDKKSCLWEKANYNACCLCGKDLSKESSGGEIRGGLKNKVIGKLCGNCYRKTASIQWGVPNDNIIWAVTYYDMGEDPVVTVFSNKSAALKCYEYFLGEHDRVNIDEVPVYQSFAKM